jgi:hypothetical protein
LQLLVFVGQVIESLDLVHGDGGQRVASEGGNLAHQMPISFAATGDFSSAADRESGLVSRCPSGLIRGCQIEQWQ